MEGQRLLSSLACGRVRLLELFQMPPRSIRSDDRNACTSSSEVPQGKLAKRAVKCHLLAVFWEIPDFLTSVSLLAVFGKSGILGLEHLKVTYRVIALDVHTPETRSSQEAQTIFHHDYFFIPKKCVI